MSVPSKIYKNDVGTVVLIDMVMDISDATTKLLRVLKMGVETVWYPEVYESTYLKYTVESGDLDVVGTYYLQPHLTFADGWSGRGNTVSFDVCDEFS